MMTKDRRQLAGAHFTDKEIASMVRMLMRDQIDHEMVCIAARDRILWLRESLDAAEAEIVTLRPYIAKMDCQHELVFLRGGACVLCANVAIRAKLEAAPHALGCSGNGKMREFGAITSAWVVGSCNCWKSNL